MEVEKQIYQGEDYQRELRKRISLLIEVMNMGFNNFARHSKVCDKTLRSFLKDDGKVLSMLTLRKFERSIHNLNPEWLWNGKGDMFVGKGSEISVESTSDSHQNDNSESSVVSKSSMKVVDNVDHVGFDENILRRNLQIVIDMLEITPFSFDKRVGLRIGTISSFMKGQKDIKDDELQKIISNLKVLNPKWLRYGEGSMILCSDN